MRLGPVYSSILYHRPPTCQASGNNLISYTLLCLEGQLAPNCTSRASVPSVPCFSHLRHVLTHVPARLPRQDLGHSAFIKFTKSKFCPRHILLRELLASGGYHAILPSNENCILLIPEYRKGLSKNSSGKGFPRSALLDTFCRSRSGKPKSSSLSRHSTAQVDGVIMGWTA